MSGPRQLLVFRAASAVLSRGAMAWARTVSARLSTPPMSRARSTLPGVLTIQTGPLAMFSSPSRATVSGGSASSTGIPSRAMAGVAVKPMLRCSTSTPSGAHSAQSASEKMRLKALAPV
ncbi:MAG TPA: hypothetical protein VMQ93_10055 [Novosphingobium sp.]|nr:hypothetical protein [Novosphingobium sp.]